MPIRKGSRKTPFAAAAGGNYGGAVATTVPFPVGRFTANPVLTATCLEGSSLLGAITNVTTAGFTFISTNGANVSVHWVATQMKPDNAVG
jgi:hypothetical protein